MNEPNIPTSSDLDEKRYREWARENKKRADRLAEAVMAYRVHQDQQTYNDMVAAQVDYEDKVG